MLQEEKITEKAIVKTYTVEVLETLRREVEVEAASEEEARQMVMSMEIILASEDSIGMDHMVITEED